MADLPDLSELPRRQWMTALRELVDARGVWTDISADHSSLLYGGGTTLLVSFELQADIRNSRDGAIPFGMAMADRNGWASLTIMATQATWYRDPALYAYFDSLIDEDVFDEFDRVVFYGEGMGGYAAGAYSVAAPGCSVVMVSPQATLDPRVTEWDPRFVSMRKTSFTDRFGFAPEMVEAANDVFLIYNPDEDLDAMHAALFARPGVTRFRCPLMGRDLVGSLDDMGLLEEAAELAAAGTLSTETFAKAYRKRRDYPPYLRALLTQVEDAGRLKLAAMLCRSVLARRNMPRMRKSLDKLIEQGVADGDTAAQDAAEA